MLFEIIFVLLLIPIALCSLYAWRHWDKLNNQEEFPASVGTAIIMSVIAGLFLIFLLILPTTIAYVNQLNDQAALRQYQENQAIYTKKANDLTHTFTTILSVQYPKFEQEIFSKIKPGESKTITPTQINAYMVAYPQLKTSAGLVKLVNEISKLRSKIYDQQLAATKTEKAIRVRHQNPCLVTWLLP